MKRDHTAPLTHKFTSSDERFNAITEDLSVVITDNDFQRSVDEDQSKLLADGNNKIIYDLDMSANDQWYTGQYDRGENKINTDVFQYELQQVLTIWRFKALSRRFHQEGLFSLVTMVMILSLTPILLMVDQEMIS